jgi:hypothetical protein
MPRAKKEEKTCRVVGSAGLSGRWVNLQVTLDNVPESALNDKERLTYLLADKFLQHLRQFVQINPSVHVERDDG